MDSFQREYLFRFGNTIAGITVIHLNHALMPLPWFSLHPMQEQECSQSRACRFDKSYDHATDSKTTLVFGPVRVEPVVVR